MELPISLRDRISNHDGFLFVRELIRGEVVARIPTAKPTLISADMDEVVRACSHTFIGKVQSVSWEGDSIHVTTK